MRDTETAAQSELQRITNVRGSAAGYKNYQQWLAGTQLEQRVSLEEYSVSNRGLRSGLVGTPAQVQDRVAEFEAIGVDLLLLQCSPQLEEMESFADKVIRPLSGKTLPSPLYSGERGEGCSVLTPHPLSPEYRGEGRISA